MRDVMQSKLYCLSSRRLHCRSDNRNRCGRPIRFTFLEVALNLGHCVRNMCEADDGAARCDCKCVECCGLHFHGKGTGLMRGRNGGFGFSIGRIRGPGCTAENNNAGKS